MHLLPILLSSMPGSKHQQKFLTHLMELLPALPGRVNFSDLSRYGGLSARTYARWFARGLEFTRQTLGFLCLAVPADHFLVWAVDGCFLPKSGKHTFGLGRFWNGCQSRVAKGLEQSCLALVDVTEGAAYAVSAQQCPPPDPQAPSCTRTSLVQALGQLREARAVAHRPAVGHVVADGAYSTQTFLQGLGELGLQAIGRLPRNACLRYPYLGPRRRGRGRPRRFDGTFQRQDVSRLQRLELAPAQVTLYHGQLHHRTFQRWLQVVYVVPAPSQTAAGVLLFSTDLALHPHQIYHSYRARFQIEFLFRDTKQHLGLTHGQARSQAKLHSHFNVTLTVLTWLKLHLRLAQKGPIGRFSMANAKRLAHNQLLLERFIARLAPHLDRHKCRHQIQKLLQYGLIAPESTCTASFS